MQKKNKIALLSIPIIAGIYLIFKQFAKGKTSASDNYVANAVQGVVSVKCKFPLKKGTYNCDYVRQMQEALNSMSQSSFVENRFTNLRPLVADGDFGSKTESVLKDFFGNAIWSAEPQVSQEDFNNILAFKGQ
jgi:hypothetical protein